LLAAMRREVNLQVNDVPLAELAARLGQSAGVPVSIAADVTADTMRATADLRGLPLHEALAKLAEAAGLSIAPQGGAVLLRLRPAAAGAAGRSSIWSPEWGEAPRSGFARPAGSDTAN
jgi:hypothetical protein